jgi:hypothetical protein
MAHDYFVLTPLQKEFFNDYKRRDLKSCSLLKAASGSAKQD